MFVDVGEFDARFLRKLKGEFDESHLACFQCGVCSASCPVIGIEAGFNPRRLVKMARLGLKRLTLSSEYIWLCSMCFLCGERCPQGVRIPEVMTALRNLAVEEGYIPEPMKRIRRLLSEAGRLYPIDDFTAEERTDRGLPQIEAEPGFVKRLTGAKP
ncbi:MAG: heterodisulfide reductase [Candidatus Bathyarchaeota archaeon B23]|nr:MAG: heterodisulfide reductase [Candidatus Bathyarchaeota archaeon B23]